jgi:hypothetical protein
MLMGDFYRACGYAMSVHKGCVGSRPGRRALYHASKCRLEIELLDDDLKNQILERLKSIEERISALEVTQAGLQDAYGKSRVHFRRAMLRPPMWTFEQHAPHQLDLNSLPVVPVLPAEVPSIAIVTPSYNQAEFLGATIDSILSQHYPRLLYRVQDGASKDGTIAVLKSYGDKISWKSEPDKGQADAINIGFDGVDSDIMGYLNSDDTLLQIFSMRDLMSTLFTDTGSSSTARDRKSAGPSCRVTTRRRFFTPATFPRRRCFGADASGTPSARWIPVSSTRSTGILCCGRRRRDSSSSGHVGFSRAFAFMINKRPQVIMMSGGLR